MNCPLGTLLLPRSRVKDRGAWPGGLWTRHAAPALKLPELRHSSDLCPVFSDEAKDSPALALAKEKEALAPAWRQEHTAVFVGFGFFGSYL